MTPSTLSTMPRPMGPAPMAAILVTVSMLVSLTLIWMSDHESAQIFWFDLSLVGLLSATAVSAALNARGWARGATAGLLSGTAVTWAFALGAVLGWEGGLRLYTAMSVVFCVFSVYALVYMVFCPAERLPGDWLNKHPRIALPLLTCLAALTVVSWLTGWDDAAIASGIEALRHFQPGT